MRLPLPDPRPGAAPRGDRRRHLRRVRRGDGVGGRPELHGHEEVRRSPEGGEEENRPQGGGDHRDGEDPWDRGGAGGARFRVPGRVDGWRGRGGARHPPRAGGAGRVRGAAGHRADDPAETAGGVPARRVSPRAWNAGHDRGEEPPQGDPFADPAAPVGHRGSMTGGAGPSGPETVRPGLSRILSAFSRSGSPETSFRTLHIAGSNGKGSTAHFAFDVLRRLPLGPLGLYTSPHLVAPEERIRVDGTTLPPRALRGAVRSAAP